MNFGLVTTVSTPFFENVHLSSLSLEYPSYSLDLRSIYQGLEELTLNLLVYVISHSLKAHFAEVSVFVKNEE